MRTADANLVVCLILATAGIAVCLVGIEWLNYLGIALLFTAGAFSSHHNRVSPRMVLLIVAMCAILGWSSGNARTPRPLGDWVVFIALWLLCLVWELSSWRKNRRLSQDA